uniref:Uncharacterized protein n=1 Tax=Arundo donax TaxID=35708 RepID=A0A0A9AK50_ARUDO
MYTTCFTHVFATCFTYWSRPAIRYARG